MAKLILGDCLEKMKEIPDGSVDLILTDPPYGIMKGASIEGWVKKGDTAEWDSKLPTDKLLPNLLHLLRQNGKVILFSQEPYSAELISKAPADLSFCQKAVWVKNVHANPMAAKSALVSRCEDILIFRKPHDPECTNILRTYFLNVMQFVGFRSAKDFNKALGHRRAEHTFYVTGGKSKYSSLTGSSQFSLCTETTYSELVETFDLENMPGYLPFSVLKKINEKYESTFNLWQGGKSKSNVFNYSKDSEHYHPTQKPVALLEDLIQTYSNPGDTVLDFTMGSGSTGVACVNTGRNFIGIELDPDYYNIATQRIQEATNHLRSKPN